MISLVIPYHNREHLLPRTLRSVAEVAVLPAEIVLVDNGSTDGSAAVCKAFSRQHPELRVKMVDEPLPGAAAARNRGLREVGTEWVFFFDSDDELDPDFFHDVLPLLPDADMVVVPTRMVIEGREVVRKYKPTADPAAQVFFSHLNTQGMVFRTSFLRQIGGWNESAMVWNDWELGVRALLNHPRVKWHTSRAYHNIYVHADSITGRSLDTHSVERLHTLRLLLPVVANNRRLMKALYLRHALLAGSFLSRGNKELYGQCLEQMREMMPRAGWFLRMKARVLMRLEGWKMPGTWYLGWLMM